MVVGQSSDDGGSMRRISIGLAQVAFAALATAPALAQDRASGEASTTAGSPTAITGRDPRSQALYLALIENLRKSGQVHAALAHLDAFDRQFTRSHAAQILRGNCLVDIKDYAGAAAAFGKQLRGPQAATAFAGLGRIEALNERWASAAAQYARAVQLAPTSASHLSDYGFVLLRAGRPADAVFRLRQAVELAPGDARARSNLVLALAASGDEPGARRLLATLTDAGQRAELEAELAAATPARPGS
jgi:tetratricopeptide (TPR) repeat protein